MIKLVVSALRNDIIRLKTFSTYIMSYSTKTSVNWTRLRISPISAGLRMKAKVDLARQLTMREKNMLKNSVATTRLKSI